MEDEFKTEQSGIIYPNPDLPFLEGYRDFGQATDEDLRYVFLIGNESPVVISDHAEREEKTDARLKRFLPPFINQNNTLFLGIIKAIAVSMTRFVGDKLLSLRRIFVGGLRQETGSPPVYTYDALRTMQQLADEYRIVRGRYETVPMLYSLIRNWRAIHMLRGTLQGPTQSQAETGSPPQVPEKFGMKWDLSRITRNRVDAKSVDGNWVLDINYPEFDETSAYNPDRPTKFLDVSQLLLLLTQNRNNLYFVNEELDDREWWLNMSFPDGYLVDGSPADEFVYDPDENHILLDVSGTLVKLERNIDGYYTNPEMVAVTRREFVPAWLHFQIIFEDPSFASSVIGFQDPVVELNS